MKKRIFIPQAPCLFYFLCSIILFFSISQSHAAESVTLQLKWKHQFQFAGYYAAIEKGYYKQENLDVTLIEGKPGGNEVDEVISGRANFGVGMAGTLLARFKGKPVVILASIFQHSPSVLLAIKGSGVSSPHDLFAQKIMMTPGYKSAELQAMLANEGIPVDKVKILKPSWKLDDLIDGKVAAMAAYISSGPYFLKQKNIPYIIISPTSYGIDFYGDNLFTSEQEINQHPNRVRAFRKASLKGWQYALEHPEEIIDIILLKYTSDRKDLTKEFLVNEASSYQKLILPQFVKIGHMNPGRWKHIADTYVKLGMADKDYSLEGLLYDSTPTKFDWGHWAIKLGIGIIIAGFVSTLFLIFFNRRLNREIYDRKQADKSLRESEERYRQTFETNQAVKLIINPQNGDIVEANGAACDYYGYSKKVLLSLKISDINVLPFHKIAEEMNHAKTLNKQAFNFQHKLASGEIREVKVFSGPVKYGQHELLYSIIHDVTDQKLVMNKLKLSESRYQKAQKLGKVGNWEYDLVTENFWASDEAKRIYGFDPESKNFTTDEVENCIPDREGVHQALIDLIESNIPYDLEFEIHPISGPKRKFIRSIAELQKDDMEEPYMVAGVVLDITQQKEEESDKYRLELNLRQAQKMESIGTLAGGIAHDFNNILSSVIGYIELALGGVEKGTELEDDLQEVRTAGLRAKDLVKQILTFARKSDEEVKPIQVNIIVKEVLKFIKSSIPATIQINDKINSDSLIMGSPTQIHQVLMNLFTNAAHAMEENGGILEVSLNDTTIDRMTMPELKPGEYIKIKVRDTGMGISPQHIHTIFEPYFTTKPVGEGTGLGLAVVHGIVENYGGQIKADSTIGKGTCFTIYLPISKKRKVYTHFEKEELPFGNENILFVDDEAPIAKMGSRALEQLGYSVTTRTSSVEALELFRSKPHAFDLVVTDMTMPNMTGDEMAAEMMNIRSDISVVLCTGYSKKISKENATEIGIKAFAYKPLSKSDLAKTVRKVLDEANSSE